MAYDTQSLCALTQKLMRFRTVQGEDGQMHDCLEFVKDFFAGTDLEMTSIVHGGSESLVITKGTKTPAIFLCGHLDVVQADDASFDPKIDGDRLMGRGALDMKSGITALMTTMKDLAQTKHDVGLMLTTDEEIGGNNGTSALLDMGYSCKAAILPDGGKAVHRVVSKAKGFMRIELKASGTTAHGSTPWLGQNAIIALAQALTRVQALFIDKLIHPEDHWVATCNIGTIEGGTAVNQVAGQARATCDIRHTEHESAQEILQRIQNVLPNGITATLLSSASPYKAPDSDRYVLAYESALAETGLLPEHGMDHGSSDARFFAERNIPVLMSQPDGDGHHTDHEWVSIGSIRTYARVVRNFLDKVSLGTD